MTAAAEARPATIGACLAAATARLAAAGVPTPRLDAELLLAHVAGRERWRLRLEPTLPLAPAAADAYRRLVEGRAARRPVSRLLGRREFWSLPFVVDDHVLDPRPDSETVVAAALARWPDRARPGQVLDLGVGTGCLLLALLSEIPNATGLGVDRSAAAVAVARQNAAALGLGQRSRFVVGDWGSALAAGFDLLVANPPYVATAAIAGLEPEVAGGDPMLALDGGHDGLDAYRALAPQLPNLLRPGGIACIECGAAQAPAVTRLLRAAGMGVLEAVRDLAGVQRCLVATAGAGMP